MKKKIIKNSLAGEETDERRLNFFGRQGRIFGAERRGLEELSRRRRRRRASARMERENFHSSEPLKASAEESGVLEALRNFLGA